MTHSLFGSSSASPAGRRGGAAFVSLMAHATGIAALVAAPFLSDAELPPVPAPPSVPTLPPVVLSGGGGSSRPGPRPSTPARSPSARRIPMPTAVVPLAPADLGEDVPACPGCAIGSSGDESGELAGDDRGPGFGPGPVGPGLEPAPAVAPVRISSLTPPRRLVFVEPEYPQAARHARIDGVVILECVIDAHGRVVDVKVLRSKPLLDEAAVAAVRQWIYAPTLLGGVPVPVVMTVTVKFGVR